MPRCKPVLPRWPANTCRNVRKGEGDFRLLEDTIKVMTMHASRGLKFPVVAVAFEEEARTGAMEEAMTAVHWNAARVLYVATTRAIQMPVLAFFPELIK